MTPHIPLNLILLDEDGSSGLDALAASVAIFGTGRFELRYAYDPGALRQTAVELAEIGATAVIVVDVDHDPEPKSFLAAAAEVGFPLVVLSDGRNDAIQDHALSVGAAGFLPTTMPGTCSASWRPWPRPPSRTLSGRSPTHLGCAGRASPHDPHDRQAPGAEAGQGQP